MMLKTFITSYVVGVILQELGNTSNVLSKCTFLRKPVNTVVLPLSTSSRADSASGFTL